MVGPDYKEPKTSVDKHWAKKDASIKETPFRNTKWWSVFHDSNLTSLIHQGYRNNLSVQSAGVHILQARAQLAQTVGELYPQQQVMNGSYNYYRMGGNYLQDVLPPSFSAATLGFSANWEVDFWGKYRRAILSNDASFLASIAAFDNALVTLTADIANNYINIRSSESLIIVTKENIQLQKISLQLTQSRYRAGEVSLLDVEEAKTMLAETESELPMLISKLQHQKDTLAVLLGLTPNDIDPLIAKNHGIPQAPSTIAVGIPKEALDRRPDIHQARLDAIAQSEAIGATKAQLYPSLSLSGSFSFAANTINNSSISDMFNWGSRNITAGPGFNWPLLNYGQITNSVRIQDATFQQALLNYLNVILIAQQEVQDNMTRYIEAKKTEYYLQKAARSAIKSTRLTIIKYREGETDYTTVLYAQQQQLRVQTSLVQAQTEVPLAIVALYRALGGGWQIRNKDDAVPEKIKDEMAARTNWGNLLKQQNHQSPVTKQETFEELYLPNW